MALAHSKFDSTPATLLADLRTAILASSDWADITPTGGPSTTQTTSLAVNATTVVVSSTAGMANGMLMVFEPGTVREEYRAIVSVVNATSFSVAGLSFAHASTSVVRYASLTLKATTTRGAQMVVDLLDGPPVLNGLALAFYRTHNGTMGGGVDKTTQRYLQWRTNTTNATSSMALHCRVSVSKEHLFISVEGPKAWEPATSNTSYGSLRNYIFIADLVPYHAADTTPAVVIGAATTIGSASVSNLSHLGFVSRNAANTASWNPVRLATLQFPSLGTTTEDMNLKNQCSIDGNRYQYPYVVFDEDEGIRGRLNRIYFVGSNQPVLSWDAAVYAGDTVPFEGLTYSYHQLNASDSVSVVWGALGSSGNNGSSTQARSVIVAIPIA